MKQLALIRSKLDRVVFIVNVINGKLDDQC